jgi:hypothetical protein
MEVIWKYLGRVGMLIERYVEVVRDALGHWFEVGARLALPLSLLLGLGMLAGVVAWVSGRRGGEEVGAWRPLAGAAAGWGGVALVLAVALPGLRASRFIEQNEARRRERAEATSNPVPDAPPVSQSGPAVAALRERTYSSSLSLPPSFLSRVSSEGLSVLEPYMAAPTPSNVLRLRDSFKRRGRAAVFSRQTTVLEEEPIPLTDSRIKVSFTRLAGRAYDALFEGRYLFQNISKEPTSAHFLFSLPQAGTVRDLRVRVGKQNANAASSPSDERTEAMTARAEAAAAGAEKVDASDPSTYKWKGVLAPGEAREAVVSYRVTGARTWSYGLGSERRRVGHFQLDAENTGGVRFARGSLQPTVARGESLSWQESDVITAQQLSLVFPSDKEGEQLYLQALTALPAALALFLVGVLALAAGAGAPAPSPRLAAALGVFALGLGASTVAATYVSPLAALLAAPIAGAALAAAVLGRRFGAVAVPAALLPAAFLSAHHTGLLVLALCAAAFGAGALASRRRPQL